jgi:Protein of unknown function (DUF2971)
MPQARRVVPAGRRGLLYHYTSADGLLGILNTGTLWATQIRFLNDTAEFTFARDALVREAHLRAKRLKHPLVKRMVMREIRRVEHGHIPAYVISFSERGNTLSQWRAYAPRDGVAIGFYRGALRKVQKFALHRCRYLSQEPQTAAQRRALSRLFDKQVQNWISFASSLIRGDLRRHSAGTRVDTTHAMLVSQAMIWAALCIKHDGFAEEREWRLIDNRSITPEGEVEQIWFRRGAFGVTPCFVATLPSR